MTTSAPSSARAQSPRLRASQGRTRHGAWIGRRLRTTTSSPRAWKARARMVPTWPVPPGITIFMAGGMITEGGWQPRVPRFVARMNRRGDTPARIGWSVGQYRAGTRVAWTRADGVITIWTWAVRPWRTLDEHPVRGPLR